MFVVNEDLSIYATRGDIVAFSVTAEDNGENYKFQPGDVVRIKVYGKKDAESVVLQKDFPVFEETEEVEIFLSEHDTKIGEVISKPTDYWYEVELNPFTNPQTIIGYDEDGAKVFKLFPEGDDIPEYVPEPEELPKVIDEELDLTSTRPVENQAIARAITQLNAAQNETANNLKEQGNALNGSITVLDSEIAVERARIDNLVSGGTADDAEVADVRIGFGGNPHATAGNAVRNQVSNIVKNIDEMLAGENINVFWRYANDGNAGKVFKFDTGEIIPTNNNYAHSELIPVAPGQKVTVYEPEGDGKCVTMMGAYFDADKNLVKGMGYHPNYTSGEATEVTVPDGVYYIGVNYHIAHADITCIAPKVDYPWKQTNNEYLGKVWCCVGDSLTEENARAEKHYFDYVAEDLGLTVLNYGVSGTGYKNGSFANRIYGSIKEDFDFMTIFGSFNDLDASWEIGEITDYDRDTLYGCMNATVNNFFVKYPTKKLALITPTPWKTGINYFGVETTLENMEEYVDALLSVAKRHRIPCLDLYHCSGLNPDNAAVLTTYYNENGTQDVGAHPNSEGHKFIAQAIKEFIKTL
jgi:lysophospholipase L1-like esterase